MAQWPSEVFCATAFAGTLVGVHFMQLSWRSNSKCLVCDSGNSPLHPLVIVTIQTTLLVVHGVPLTGNLVKEAPMQLGITASQSRPARWPQQRWNLLPYRQYAGLLTVMVLMQKTNVEVTSAT